jgi:hypothetical protein
MDPHGFAYLLDQGKIVWDDEPLGIQGEDFLREATFTPQAPLAREHQFEQDRAAKSLHERLSGGKVRSRFNRRRPRTRSVTPCCDARFGVWAVRPTKKKSQGGRLAGIGDYRGTDFFLVLISRVTSRNRHPMPVKSTLLKHRTVTHFRVDDRANTKLLCRSPLDPFYRFTLGSAETWPPWGKWPS